MSRRRVAARRLRARGFTIVELLMGSLVFLLIGVAILTAFLSGGSSYLSVDTSIQVQQEARRALDEMVRELREAGNVTEPVDQQLDFQLALGYNLGAVDCPSFPTTTCWGARDESNIDQPDWRIQYRINAKNQLIRETLNAASALQWTRVLANDVNPDAASTNFVVTATNVTLTLEVQSAQNQLLPGGTRSTGPMTSSVRLRNN